MKYMQKIFVSLFVFVITIVFVSENVFSLDVACVGDSITAGGSKYCSYLDATEHTTYNYGISGDTSSGVLSRIANNVTGKGYNATIILIGTNDVNNQNFQYTKKDVYYNNLKSIVNTIVADGQIVILSTLPPCNSFSRGCSLKTQVKIIERNNIIRRVSYDTGACYADIFTNVFLSSYNISQFSDVVHPTSATQSLMSTSYYNQLGNCVPYNCISNFNQCYGLGRHTLKISR